MAAGEMAPFLLPLPGSFPVVQLSHVSVCVEKLKDRLTALCTEQVMAKVNTDIKQSGRQVLQY